MPTVEILACGTELMRGDSVDTNSAWLSRELLERGLEVRVHTTVGDDFDAMVEAITLAASRSDIVIWTGGLGPTKDDLTREAAAHAFGLPLVFRPASFRKIRARFRKFRIPMARSNRRQATLPRGARELKNPIGTAPGFGLKYGSALFFAMPGVPREMKPMFRDLVLPKLPARRDVPISKLKAVGMPEGDVDEIVSAAAKGVPYGLTVSSGTVTISIRSRGTVVARIRRALGKAYLGEGRTSLAEAVVSLLRRRRATIAIAESCTGGRVAHMLTEVPGVSAVLLEALVTYHNESKVERLGVPASLIRKHGAVSEEVARSMAEGVAETSGADVGVSTTGIAGPTGGTIKKPVGLTYLAVSWRGRTRVRRVQIPGDRSQVKGRAAGAALNLVRLTLK